MNDSTMPRLIEGNPTDSLADLPGRNADKDPQRVAFSVKESGAWRDVTAAQFNLEVRALAKGLIAQGLEPGDRLTLGPLAARIERVLDHPRLIALRFIGNRYTVLAGLAGHGLKDLWQHRTGFVADTRWWPPFCATVDFVAATIIAVAIVAGFHFSW